MKSNFQKGSSTIEILIAFVILILTISAVIIVLFGNQSVSVDTQTSNEALYRAQTMLEQARAASRADFASIVSQASTVEQSGSLSYTKKLDVADIDAFTKQATSTVTWIIGGRSFTTILSTLLTDPSSALGGDTCSPTISGDWTRPQLLGTADLGQNNGGTDVDVLNKKAYVTADASAVNKGDFYIIDVSNPNLSNLPVLNSAGLNTGPGLAAVSVAGKYAYVANISTVTQLQIIDISAPNTPVVVASLKVTAGGDAAVGNSIFYANKRIYLGLTKSTGAEFYIIDVSSPLTPIVKVSFEINSQVNAIRVKNNVAYLAVPDDPSTPAIAEQLKILDVSQVDTGIITQIGTFHANNSTMSGEGVYLSKDGNTLYLGEGGPANASEFFTINVTNPANPNQINSKYVAASINAIAVRSNLAFLWTSDTNKGFQIWDLNNLNTPTPYGSLNTQQTATGGFDCEGSIIYVAQRSNKALQIIGPS